MKTYDPCWACEGEQRTHRGRRYKVSRHVECPCSHDMFYHIKHICTICEMDAGITNRCLPIVLRNGDIYTIGNCGCKACRQGIHRKLYSPVPMSIGTSSDMGQAGIALGLDPNLSLTRAAADFYYLWYLELTYPVDCKVLGVPDRLDVLTRHLAEQLSTYLGAACAGEFRHLDGSQSHIYNESTRKLASILGYRNQKERHLAWANWPLAVEKFGLVKALSIMEDGFKQYFSLHASVGGIRWSICARIAKEYALGKYSDRVFVDLALGLKHNGNIAYNKFWNTNEIVNVLNAARQDKIYVLDHYISSEVRKIALQLDKESITDFQQLVSSSKEIMYEQKEPKEKIDFPGVVNLYEPKPITISAYESTAASSTALIYGATS